jgi:transcriptional regulator with XRE-family HTH domain
MSSGFLQFAKIIPKREEEGDMTIQSIDMRTIQTNELDTFGGRIAWLLRTRKYKQKDLVEALDKSSGFVSEVARADNKKEFDWGTTAKLVRFLRTNGDFFLGLTDDDRPLKEIAGEEQAPYYKHEESDEIAKLCDEAPEWLRQQMLSVARVQLETAKAAVLAGDSAEWAERLRSAAAVSGLVLGEEQSGRFMRELDSILQDFIVRRTTAAAPDNE